MASNLKSWQSRSTFELYQEREQIAWYSRWIATLSPTLILLGFLVFPASFATETNTVASSSTLSVVAVVLLALGYSLSVALWFIYRSWLFQFDVIFIPCVLSCLFGFLNTIISLSIHPAAPTTWTTSSIASLSLALISTLIYAFLSILIHRKIARARRGGSITHGHQKTSSNPETDTLLTEEELQRRNFDRLLAQKSDSPRISPLQSTFNVYIPDNAVAANRRHNPPSIPLTYQQNPISPSFNSPNNPTTSVSHFAAPTAAYDSVTPPHSLSRPSSQQPLRPTNTNSTPNYSRSSPSSRQPFHEDSVNARQAALSAARARSRNAESAAKAYNRTLPASPPSTAAVMRDRSPSGPPVIVNTRHNYAADISDIPLSERHPLERSEGNFVAARRSNDKEEYERLYAQGAGGGVWRAEDHMGENDTYEREREEGVGTCREEDAGPAYEIIEGEDVQIDLGGEFVRRVPYFAGGRVREREEGTKAIVEGGPVRSPGFEKGAEGRGRRMELDGDWTERRELEGAGRGENGTMF